MHPKVKICGMKNAETIKTAIDHKVDFLGFVFYPDSPRNLTPKQALKLGATHLVIGRDITKGNPKTNIKKVLNALI